MSDVSFLPLLAAALPGPIGLVRDEFQRLSFELPLHLPGERVLATPEEVGETAKVEVEIEVAFVTWLVFRRARGRAEEKRARPWLRAGFCNMKMWQ